MECLILGSPQPGSVRWGRSILLLVVVLVVRSGSGHWPLSRPVISTEQSKGQMQSVEIP
eukprot:COSAG02_NODE_3503_length_6644_cov_3.803820_1_plen_58_part_10